MGYLSGQWKMKDHGHLSEATPLPSIGIFDSLSTAPTQRKERGFMHSSPPPASNHIAYKTVYIWKYSKATFTDSPQLSISPLTPSFSARRL
jgi:hypothetical protein